MRITYYGAQGQVRMVYLNVSTYSVKGKLVELERHEPAAIDATTGFKLNNYDFGQYHTVAIISLAPGEYLEWGKDAERS